MWQHVIDVYQRDHGKGSGLSMVPKLTFEHLYLTSFSKMRVDLASQVGTSLSHLYLRSVQHILVINIHVFFLDA